MTVDIGRTAVSPQPPGPVRAIHLTSRLFIGASVDYRSVFESIRISILFVNVVSRGSRSAYVALICAMPACQGG